MVIKEVVPLLYVSLMPALSVVLVKMKRHQLSPGHHRSALALQAKVRGDERSGLGNRVIRRIVNAYLATTRLAKPAPVPSPPAPAAGPARASAAPEPAMTEEGQRLALMGKMRGLPLAKQIEVLRAQGGTLQIPRGANGSSQSARRGRFFGRSQGSPVEPAEPASQVPRLAVLSVRAPLPTFSTRSKQDALASPTGIAANLDKTRERGDPAFRYDTFYNMLWSGGKEPPPPPQSHFVRSPRSQQSSRTTPLERRSPRVTQLFSWRKTCSSPPSIDATAACV